MNHSPETGAAERLTRTVWMFGSTDNGPYGHMTLRPDGRVGTRDEPNEYRWELGGDGRLSFFTARGEVTSVLAPGAGGSWLSVAGFPHWMHPVFALGPPPPKGKGAPVFVNSVPKAGTYLMAKALERLGYGSTGVHAMDEMLFDNREVPEAEWHFEPAAHSVAVTAPALAGLLRPGEFTVGHVLSPARMAAIRAAGVQLVNLVREPRAQLVSNFVFLREKVKPGPDMRLWMGMEGLDGFKAYLLAAPIRSWIDQAAAIVETQPFLRFEDLRAGEVSRAAAGAVLARRLPAALKAVRDTPTSTYIPGDRSEIMGWVNRPEVLAYLEELGAMDLSRRVWPELN